MKVRDDLGTVLGQDAGHRSLAAGEALLRGELDAVFLIASAESPSVQRLLRNPGVTLMDFERAEAYTRRHRYLSSVNLPRGVIDLDLDLPPADVELLAVSANLVVRRDLHPALIDLLLQTADQVHAGGGLFEEPGEFPSPRYLDFPLHKEAKRYYKSGPPFLQRYLPFWAASLLDRLKVMLLPLVAWNEIGRISAVFAGVLIAVQVAVMAAALRRGVFQALRMGDRE